MNPINDEMLTNENPMDTQTIQALKESIEILEKSKENLENNKLINQHKEDKEEKLKKTKNSGRFNISEDLKKITNDNNDSNESNGIKEHKNKPLDASADDFKQTDKLIENFDSKLTKEMNGATKAAVNKEECFQTETMDGDEMGEFEDVVIPGEEEVDEIIVPDEAEAEDLTDDKNEHNINKLQNEEEDIEEDEETTVKDSETEENEVDISPHEEENTKSSEAVDEKYDDESDKKSLNNFPQDDTCSKDYEDNNLTIEPELVAIEEASKDTTSTLEGVKINEENLDEDTTSQTNHDPLNCTDNQENEGEVEDIIKNVNNENSLDNKLSVNNDTVNTNGDDDDEDDEVQFVETRNSPICIESDDDDADSKSTADTCSSLNNTRNENNKQTITTATSSVTVPKNIIVTRTSARKSTAKPPQQRHQQAPNQNSPTSVSQLQNKPKNFHYLQKATNYKRPHVAPSAQHIVDCIELLDSSDEETTSTSSRPQLQQSKTPQKRTLLAAKGNYYKSNTKNSNVGNNHLPNNFSPHVRQQIKKPAPPPLPPPTPQSNFLNAVQLQPASISGANPPAFSALLSNKNVIIPNAFYGNPPSVRGTSDTDIERRYARWLENFLHQFCNPQFVATHSCFVFLQRALKYQDFVRIKTLRTSLNNHAQTASNDLNTNLMSDLRTLFLKNTKKITIYGRRFCELTCSSAISGKTVALMAHAITGKVTLKTCNMDVPKTTNSVISSTSNTNTNSLTRKRQLDEDEDEYTPDKSKGKTKSKALSENGDEDSSEAGDGRKRSLRTKRTKRLDNSFSYNEDDLLAEYEIDDEDDAKLAQLEIQRKIEQKRLEAQRKRQQQVKSFESAFIQAFVKSIDEPTTSATTSNANNLQRIRMKNTTTVTATTIRQYTTNNDAEDLLQATWIENVENDDTQVISDDDEPKEHRIYKQQQQQQHQQFEQNDYYLSSNKLPTRYTNSSSKTNTTRVSKRNEEEIITGDDDYDENNYFSNSPSNIDPIYWPKNVDPQMHVNGKHKDRCVICNLSCQRLVHHYVNEHRGCEVYNSRLSTTQIKQLKQGNYTGSNVSLYKNGQFQYEAFCVFCQKQSRFMLPYWYQHFTMHTGEYAYRCTGCGIRKPTRSLLTQHQAQGCPQAGGIIQDYAHDSKSMKIEARICTLCNYVQMHRSNIVKHLHQQHNIKQILPKHIQTIVLMKTPATLSATSSPSPSPSSSAVIKRVNYKPISNNRSSTSSSSSFTSNTYIIDDDDNEVSYEEITPEETSTQINSENNYYNYIPPYMQAAVNSGNFSFEDVDAGDDLSFMICVSLKQSQQITTTTKNPLTNVTL
ncbi:uncharacterized protein ACRADG_007164 isoform 1-T2 [Cochliomyia hominivorax]